MPPERFRPAIHLSPNKGWLNDPNGLIRHGADWHVFYQHYPNDTVHGPMHWGHAVTRDFLTWEHKPIALAPENGWTCYSGSAVRLDDGSVKVFYSDHKDGSGGAETEHQSLVHVDLESGTFSRDGSNPVLKSKQPGPFRDPKVIWHENTGRWVMLVTIGQAIEFYSSNDLKNWTFECVFGEGQGFHSAQPWECPDLVRLRSDDGESAWILFVSVGGGTPMKGTATQYFVGDFSGSQFRNLNASSTVLWVDVGRDFYAAQTFFADDNEQTVMLGWLSNWEYAAKTPTDEFRGAMSHPRCLTLMSTPDGLRLIQALPSKLKAAIPTVDLLVGKQAPLHYRFSGALQPGEGLFLFGEEYPQLSRSEDGLWLSVSRYEPWAFVDAPEFCGSNRLPCDSWDISFECYVDTGIVELSLNEGQRWISQLHFPRDLVSMPRIQRLKATSSAA